MNNKIEYFGHTPVFFFKKKVIMHRLADADSVMCTVLTPVKLQLQLYFTAQDFYFKKGIINVIIDYSLKFHFIFSVYTKVLEL